jgi:hypothetical protein
MMTFVAADDPTGNCLMPPPRPQDIFTKASAAKRQEIHWAVAISALDALTTAKGNYEKAREAMHNALATEGWLAD